MLELRNLSKVYDGLVVLRDVSLKVTSGEALGVFGPNGSGKSTMLKIIAGLEKPSCGRVLFDGRDITGLSPHKVVRAGIAYSFQLPRPFKELSVIDNITVPLLTKFDKEEARRRAEKLLREFKIEYLAERKASDLSQGEVKILEVVRAIACEPKLLLLDEPFAGIDASNARKMMDIILKMKSRRMIIITAHRMKILRRIADSFVELRDGKVVRKFKKGES